MSDAKMIRVWAWEHAPEQYRSLSTCGGDEDWIALVPHGYSGWIGWAQAGTPFGVCDVSEHQHEDGLVIIGAHA